MFHQTHCTGDARRLAARPHRAALITLVPLAVVAALATLAAPLRADWQQANGPEPPVVEALARGPSSYFLGSNEADAGDLYRSADGVTWHNALLPNGGVNTILTTDTVALVGTYLGGLYRSTDGGDTWHRPAEGLSSFTINALAAHGDTAFAGLVSFGSATVYRSTDDGDHWTALSTGFTEHCEALHFNGAIVLAGLDTAGIQRSTDAGTSWTPASGIPASASVRAFDAAAGILYAGVDVPGDPSVFGIYRSLDQGASWSRVSTDLAGVTALTVRAIAHRETALYAALDGSFGGAGLYRSLDGGVHWTRISQNLPVEDRILSLLVDGDTLLVGTRDGVHATSDEGVTWTDAGHGTAAIRGVGALRDVGGTLQVGLQDAAAVGRGVWRTTDAGETWLPPGPAFPMNTTATDFTVDGPELLAAFYGLERGVFRSTDGGATWEERSNGIPTSTVLRAVLAHDGVLLAGAFEGLYRSTDGGDSWSTVPGITEVSVLASSGDDVVAGTYGQGVDRSTDAGATWEAVNAGLVSTQSRFINTFTVQNGTLFAGTQGAGAFRLENDTWQACGTFGSGFTDDLLSVDGVLVAADALDDLYTSVDGGETWLAFNQGFAGGEVYELALEGERLWAGTRGRALWFRPRAELPGTAAVVTTPVAPVPSPAVLALPNPFRRSLILRLDATAASGPVRIRLHDALGRRVADSAAWSRGTAPGTFVLEGDPIDRLASGVYFYEVQTSGRRHSGRVVLER